MPLTQQDLKQIKSVVESSISPVHKRLDQLTVGFDQLTKQVDQQSGRLDQLDHRLDQQSAQLDQQSGRLDQLDHRLDQQSASLFQLNSKVDQLEQKIDNMPTKDEFFTAMDQYAGEQKTIREEQAAMLSLINRLEHHTGLTA